MIYDLNSNGYVSIDETMSMLYSRYGREKMEDKIAALFKSATDPTGDGKVKEEGKEGGEINFNRYVEAAEKAQIELFNDSELGKSIIDKKKKKKEGRK